jgi:hypothetical protein
LLPDHRCRDIEDLIETGNFLKQNFRKMPWTMLRSASERFGKEDREAYLKGMV